MKFTTKLHHLYAYSLPNDTTKVGQLKVGDTIASKGAEARIKEQIGASRSKYIKHIETELVTYDNKYFRDYEVHKELKKMGFTNTDGEWFICTPEDVKQAVHNLTKEPVLIPFAPRKKQVPIINFIKDNIKTDKVVPMNLSVATRAGKTTAIMEAFFSENIAVVYIGKSNTAIASALNDFNNFKFSKPGKLAIVSINGEFDENNPDPKMAQKFTDSLKEAGITGDIAFVVDEVDSASHSTKSIATYQEIMKIVPNDINARAFVTMSATRSHRGTKVLKGVFDEDIIELSIPYYEMEKIDPKTTLKRKVAMIGLDRADKYSFSDSLDKTNPIALQQTASFLFDMLGDLPDYKMAVQEKAPHVFLYYSTDTKKKISNLQTALKKLDKNNDFYFFNMTGEYSSNREAEKDVNDVIEEHKNKRIVILTRGMATTSFSVTTIGRTINVTNDISAVVYQGAHRSTTPETDKNNNLLFDKEAQMIFVTPKNEEFKFTPDPAALEIIESASDNEDIAKTYKNYLDMGYSIFSQDIVLGGSSKQVRDISDFTVDELGRLMDEFGKYTATLENLSMDIDDEFDISEFEFEDLKGLLSAKEMKNFKAGKAKKPSKENAWGEPVEPKEKKKNLEMTKNDKAISDKIASAMISAALVHASSGYSSNDIKEYTKICESFNLPENIVLTILKSKTVKKRIISKIRHFASMGEDKIYLEVFERLG